MIIKYGLKLIKKKIEIYLKTIYNNKLDTK